MAWIVEVSMRFRGSLKTILSAAIISTVALPALAQAPRSKQATDAKATASPYSSTQIALESIAPAERELVRGVIDRPTLRARGPVEIFTCQPLVYSWMLDRPDVAVRLWRGLGAKCTDILVEEDNRFAWRDDSGNHVTWRSVLRSPTQRVWYAEGLGKPGLLLPAISVRAVVVLHYAEGRDRSKHSAIRHQAELIVQTDSKAVALATRLLGASAPHIAEQYAVQIQTFFGGLAWYLDQEPELARELLDELQRNPPANNARPLESRRVGSVSDRRK